MLGTKAIGDSFIVAFSTRFAGGEVKLDGVEVTDWKWVSLENLEDFELTFPTLPEEAADALKLLETS